MISISENANTGVADSSANKTGNFSSKTLRNQYGTYPAWMPKRKIQKRAGKIKKKSMC